MNVRRAVKNPIQGVRTFYVESESEPGTEHMVVEVRRDGRTTYYCNCDDYFCRRLPFIHTNLFSNCRHSTRVIEALQ
jgi:hypothetical protein